jgi:hypothetical protein
LSAHNSRRKFDGLFLFFLKIFTGLSRRLEYCDAGQSATFKPQCPAAVWMGRFPGDIEKLALVTISFVVFVHINLQKKSRDNHAAALN